MFVWLSIYLEIRLAHRDFHFFFPLHVRLLSKKSKNYSMEMFISDSCLQFRVKLNSTAFRLFLLLFLSVVSCYAYNSSIHKDRCSELQRTLQWFRWYFFWKYTPNLWVNQWILWFFRGFQLFFSHLAINLSSKHSL